MTQQPFRRATGHRQAGKHVLYAVLLGVVLGTSAVSQETLPLPSEYPPSECPPFNDPSILEISTDIAPRVQGEVTDNLPPDCNPHGGIVYSSLELQPTGSIGRPHYYGARFYHRPLYFEDPILERYGYSHGCLQPAISGVKFYGSALLLPVKMLRLPPHSCVSTPPCM